MQVYFSHSYRDVAINSHFLEFFLDEEIPLQADQKTEVWCTGVARFLTGSVAERVMRKAKCPVLTIKAPFEHLVTCEAAPSESVSI